MSTSGLPLTFNFHRQIGLGIGDISQEHGLPKRSSIIRPTLKRKTKRMSKMLKRIKSKANLQSDSSTNGRGKLAKNKSLANLQDAKSSVESNGSTDSKSNTSMRSSRSSADFQAIVDRANGSTQKTVLELRKKKSLALGMRNADGVSRMEALTSPSMVSVGKQKVPVHSAKSSMSMSATSTHSKESSSSKEQSISAQGKAKNPTLNRAPKGFLQNPRPSNADIIAATKDEQGVVPTAAAAAATEAQRPAEAKIISDFADNLTAHPPVPAIPDKHKPPARSRTEPEREPRLRMAKMRPLWKSTTMQNLVTESTSPHSITEKPQKPGKIKSQHNVEKNWMRPLCDDEGKAARLLGVEFRSDPERQRWNFKKLDKQILADDDDDHEHRVAVVPNPAPVECVPGDTDRTTILSDTPRQKLAPVHLPRRHTDEGIVLLSQPPSIKKNYTFPLAASEATRLRMDHIDTSSERAYKTHAAMLTTSSTTSLAHLGHEEEVLAPPLPTKSPLRVRRAETAPGQLGNRNALQVPVKPERRTSSIYTLGSGRSPSSSVKDDSHFHFDKICYDGFHPYIETEEYSDDELNASRPDSMAMPSPAIALLPEDSDLFRVSAVCSDQYEAVRQRVKNQERQESPSRMAAQGSTEFRSDYRLWTASGHEGGCEQTSRESGYGGETISPNNNFPMRRESMWHTNVDTSGAFASSLNLVCGGVGRGRRNSFEYTDFAEPSSPINDEEGHLAHHIQANHSHQSSSSSSFGPNGRPLSMLQFAGNPIWIPNLNPEQEHFFLAIGENVSDEPLHLRLPVKRLAYHSKIISDYIEAEQCKQHIHPMLRQPFRLAQITPLIFQIWLSWVFKRDLLLHLPWNRRKGYVVKEPTIDQTLDAWLLGQELKDADFQDACVDQIVYIARQLRELTDLFRYAKRVSDISTTQSPLCRMFLAIMCEEKLPRDWRADENLGRAMVGATMFEAYKRERKQNKDIWDARKKDKEVGSWREGGCRFHSHGPGDCGAARWRSGVNEDF